MNKRLSNIFLSFLLCIVLLAATAGNTNAQAPVGNGVVTFADLGKTEVNLNGPFDTSTLTYGLPSDWKFTGDARISLNITSTFINTELGGDPVGSGGTLAVSFNRKTVATLVLNQVGTFDYEIDVPAELLVSPRTDRLMELKFTLSSGISCIANQHMNVVINAISRTTFLYEEQVPDTALANFPRPIIQSTIFPDFAYIVIPDEPTAMELQSAYTVASGLGNMSSSKIGLELVTVSQLTDAQKAAAHLIFVGKAASIPSLTEFTLPLKIQNGAFALPKDGQDNGVVQMVNSPWTVRNAVLIVSGNTDLGTLKAAQAVSTGILQENVSPNLAIVEEIQDTAPIPLVIDQTFADLGYDSQQFTNRGVDSQFYNFYIPSGNTLSGDAYFELAFGHSALLNYSTSGIVVLLNSQPIGSVRFNDTTAAQAINRVRVSIPGSVVIPGNNRIEVRASLEPLDQCTDPNLRGLWTMIWPDSRLHLPYSSTQFINTQSALDLSAFPAPMIFDSTLSTTAVILQRNDLESWRTFTHVASYLGDRSNGAITKLSVFFDDELADVDLAQYNLIVVGRPSQLAIMEELNAALPVPFEKGSDITQGKFLQVTYQVPPQIPVGYVELMPSPWNSEKVVIATLGNTGTGVNWGVSALSDLALRSQLAGDFAVINDTRVQTIDTRLVLPVANTPEASSPTGVSIPQVQPSPSPNSRPVWLFPALILVIALIVVVVGVAMVSSFRSTRKNN